MDYYHVMLVDDEEEVRSAIERKINWEEIGFQVVATAENGQDALEKAETLSLDVVMTDIQMPFMDGLTFLKKLKAEMPGLKSVIFSGFDEFEYAQEAIRLEAEEYILKPIDANELRALFERIKASLDEERSRKRDIEKLRAYYAQSLPILQEQFWIGLLEGRIGEKAALSYRSEYGVEAESSFYAVGLLQPSLDAEKDTGLEKGLLSVSLVELADETLENRIPAVTLRYFDNIVVIGLLKSTSMHREFISAMDNICFMAKRVLDVSVQAGVGRIYGSIASLHQSYKEAKDALGYRILLEDTRTICIQDVEHDNTLYDDQEEKHLQKILREIKLGSVDSLKVAIDNLMLKTRKSDPSLLGLQLLYAEFMVELIRLGKSMGVDVDTKVPTVDFKNEIASFSNMEEFGQRLFQLALTLKEKIDSERVNSTKQLTMRAQQYIAEHYRESDLSVERLCNHLGVSATYFSTLFKKETGVSFITYLTNERMRMAQHLLDTTDEKSYMIAGMVGYEEPNYFSYVFKKHFGISPSKYRQK